MTTTPALLPFPTTLIVVKGCPALNVAIRERAAPAQRRGGLEAGHQRPPSWRGFGTRCRASRSIVTLRES